MKLLFSFFLPKAPVFIVYMLQQVEYRARPFVEWLRHLATTNRSLSSVMHRQVLDKTAKARLLLLVFYVLAVLCVAFVGVVLWYGKFSISTIITVSLMIAAYPFIVAAVAVALVSGAYQVIVRPQEERQRQLAKTIMKNHKGSTIVVAGSYGKTTMKELLYTILGAKLNVAATKGNRNTPSAHAQFAQSLSGNEDVVIFELGEGAPGDVKRFAETLHPDFAVVTGLAPNHLDQYGSVGELARDFLSLRKYVPSEKLYFAADSTLLNDYLQITDRRYGVDGGATWKVSEVNVSADSTSFVLHYRHSKVNVESKLLGRHQIAPLAFVTMLALEMGMSVREVETAHKHVEPYPHRMSVYRLSGAAIIDDTYNGNFEGIMAGLNFLGEIEGRRKIYVTPGLVDQGEETERIHRLIAQKLYEIKPDLLVLMRNSATDIIRDELGALGYDAEIQIQDDPLMFYQGLEHFLRAGDVVLMQNDWTDNYH